MMLTLAVVVAIVALIVLARALLGVLAELGFFDGAAESAWDRLARWGILPGSEPVVIWRRAWRLWMVVFAVLAVGAVVVNGPVSGLIFAGLGMAAGVPAYSRTLAGWHAAWQYPRRRGRCMWCGDLLPRDERNACLPCACGWTPPGGQA